MCILVYFLLVLTSGVFSQRTGSGTNGNLRVCVVDGRGAHKRVGKLCPILDTEESGVECVLGTDRLDCLRRMSKNTVDFGVFMPEDLVAAKWANLDVLITNELRNRKRQFERSIVAVVNRRILKDSITPVHAVLKNTTLCHPGLGADDNRGLSDTLDEYLQSLIMEKSCDPSLTLTENKIKSIDDYFFRACKPGQWVPDKDADLELKKKYPNLCKACLNHCTKEDSYYGDSGSLLCLSQSGDFAWAQLERVQAYFGILSNTTGFAPADEFAYLCRDGSWQPLTDNPSPCVWLNVPWPVVVAKRKSSEEVSNLALALTDDSVTTDSHWKGALASLLEVNQAQPEHLRPQKTPLDYLAQAQGFSEAYSQTACSPPRHITICTTTLTENNKCEWMSEAASVYGITPPLQCAYRITKDECFQMVSESEESVTIADSDWLIKGERDYDTKPLLYEVTPILEQTRTVVAYTKKDSQIDSFEDLYKKRAAFPNFDGFIYNAVSSYLSKREKRCSRSLLKFFDGICAPPVNNTIHGYNFSNVIHKDLYKIIKEDRLYNDLYGKLTKLCFKDGGKVLSGERQAIRALIEGRVDVAFVSMEAFKEYTANFRPDHESHDLTPLCADKKYCFIFWSNLGHIYATKNITELRKQEIINVFTKLDQLFGKNAQRSPMFAMYGKFNHENDVLFHNNTKFMASVDILDRYPFDSIPMNFERELRGFDVNSCNLNEMLENSSSVRLSSWVFGCLVSLGFVFKFR